jgi:hypothetical protein
VFAPKILLETPVSVVVRLSAGPQPERSVATGTTAGELFESSLDVAGAQVVAASVNGVPRDLSHLLADGDRVELIRSDSSWGA